MPLILYVDDEANALKYMERALRGECELISCQEIEPALRVIETRGQDLDAVIADDRMPKMSGRAILRVAQLRNEKASRILTTGYAEVSLLADCVNEGLLDRIILKPWDGDSLLDQILSAVTSKASTDKSKARSESFANLDASVRRLEMASSAFAAQPAMADLENDYGSLLSLVNNEIGTIGSIVDGVYSNDASLQMLFWRDTCDLEECLTKAIGKLPQADQTHPRLRINLPDGPMLLRGSKSPLVLVLAELLAYAFFVARDAHDGSIDVSVDKENNLATVTISGKGTCDTLEVARSILIGRGAYGGLGLSVISWVVRQSGGAFKARFVDEAHIEMKLTYPLLLN